MTIAELVKRLLEADATANVIAIAVQAVEEEREPPPRQRASRAKRPEIVAQRA